LVDERKKRNEDSDQEEKKQITGLLEKNHEEEKDLTPRQTQVPASTVFTPVVIGKIIPPLSKYSGA